MLDTLELTVDLMNAIKQNHVSEIERLAPIIREKYDAIPAMDQRRFRNMMYRRTGQFGHAIKDNVLTPETIQLDKLVKAAT